MPKKLGVERAQNDGVNICYLEKVLDLFFAADHEIAGVKVSRSLSPAWYINLFIWSPASDPMIFDSRKFPVTIGRQIRTEIIEVQVKTDIPIKVPVRRIAGIPLLRAPDLFA